MLKIEKGNSKNFFQNLFHMGAITISFDEANQFSKICNWKWDPRPSVKDCLLLHCKFCF